jgi:hypothetical protein
MLFYIKNYTYIKVRELTLEMVEAEDIWPGENLLLFE